MPKNRILTKVCLTVHQRVLCCTNTKFIKIWFKINQIKLAIGLK